MNTPCANIACMIDLLRSDRSPRMAHISVHAFGIGMIFRVPDDADTSGFSLGSFKSEKMYRVSLMSTYVIRDMTPASPTSGERRTNRNE